MQIATSYQLGTLIHLNEKLTSEALIKSCLQLDANILRNAMNFHAPLVESIDILEDFFEYLWKQDPENWSVKLDEILSNDYAQQYIFSVYGGYELRECYASFMISAVKNTEGDIENFSLMKFQLGVNLSLCA